MQSLFLLLHLLDETGLPTVITGSVNLRQTAHVKHGFRTVSSLWTIGHQVGASGLALAHRSHA